MTTKPKSIWFATTSVDVNAAKQILPFGWHDEDKESKTVDELKKMAAESRTTLSEYQAGRPVEPTQLGTQFALRKRGGKPGRPQAFMQIFGRMVVTGETRRLLEDLAPGPLRFHQIEVFNTARTKPLWDGAELYVMQVLTCRRAVVIEESIYMTKRVGALPDGATRYSLNGTDIDDVYSVTQPPSDGSEMWLDDRFDGALFLTDRIAKALKADKLTNGWGLRRCTVKTLH